MISEKKKPIFSLNFESKSTHFALFLKNCVMQDRFLGCFRNSRFSFTGINSYLPFLCGFCSPRNGYTSISKVSSYLIFLNVHIYYANFIRAGVPD